MLKRRKRKHYRVHTKEEIWCSKCKTTSVMSNSDVEELVCGDCFGRQFYYDELKEEKETVTYVTGWNLKKKYKAPDGKIYSFGEQITGEVNANNTKKSSNKVKSVSKNTSRDDKQVLPKKNRKRGNKKTKKSKTV